MHLHRLKLLTGVDTPTRPVRRSGNEGKKATSSTRNRTAAAMTPSARLGQAERTIVASFLKQAARRGKSCSKLKLSWDIPEKSVYQAVDLTFKHELTSFSLVRQAIVSHKFVFSRSAPFSHSFHDRPSSSTPSGDPRSSKSPTMCKSWSSAFMSLSSPGSSRR